MAEAAGTGYKTNQETPNTSNTLKLKKLEYPQFYGGIAFYARFIRDYQTLIVPTNSDSSHRAIILTTQCLKGDALEATKHMVYEAKILQELKTRWGANEDLVYRAQRDIEALKPCSQTNKQFVEFVDKLRVNYSELEQIGMEEELSSLPLLQSITRKLPFKINEQLVDLEEYTAASTPAKMPILMEFLEGRRNLAHRIINIRGEKGESSSQIPSRKVLAAGGAEVRSEYSCPVRGCNFEKKHPIWRCGVYWNLSVPQRIGLVKKEKLCRFCLGGDCEIANPFDTNTRSMCRRGQRFSNCGIDQENGQKCTAMHHRSLHGTRQEEAQGLALSTKTLLSASLPPPSDVLMITQKIDLSVNGKPYQALTVFDTGSTDTFITHEFAQKSNATSVPITYRIEGIKRKRSTLNTRKYFLEVVDSIGHKRMIEAIGLNTIISKIDPVHFSR